MSGAERRRRTVGAMEDAKAAIARADAKAAGTTTSGRGAESFRRATSAVARLAA